MSLVIPKRQALLLLALVSLLQVAGQSALKTKYNNSRTYSGIEIGSKGVKMSVIEIGRNAKSSGAFHILKDTTINTDFIYFTEPSFASTLSGAVALYRKALTEYNIPSERIFTVVSSGVKMQAEKDNKSAWIERMIRSFREQTGEPDRKVEVVDVEKEAMLSHVGIIPVSRRYNTFLIDIGSGNTKGGFFPNADSPEFRLFQLNWGTRSVANATEKRLETDASLSNFNKHLQRVLAGAENSEIVYAVNASGAFSLSDNIAASGGIAWAVATLTHPELMNNTIVAVTYEEVKKFSEKLYADFPSLDAGVLTRGISKDTDRQLAMAEIEKVKKVFDQRSLMSGTGLLLKIMRQFESVYDTKTFYLVKNGQVGWVSAYVDDASDH